MDQDKLSREIYREYGWRLKKFIAQKIDNPYDVEEVFQETIIAAVDSFPMFSGKSSLFTWLCGIAKHEVSDFYRKKKIKSFLFSHFPWLENLACQALGPEQILLRKEFEQKIKATMAGLNEGYQQVLRLKYYQGKSVKQIALELNETAKAIESRLTRARKAFAQVFISYPGERGLSSCR